MKGTYALLSATLTTNGQLLSNLHFEINYIGNEQNVWKEFYRCAKELYNVDLFDSVSTPFARGIDPETGFVIVYRIQRIK